MSDQGIKVCDNADAARWVIAEHRADVLDMAQAVAAMFGAVAAGIKHLGPLTTPGHAIALQIREMGRQRR